MENFFKKLEYWILVKVVRLKMHHLRTKLKPMSEANVQKNSIRSTKWTYHKERIFASTYLNLFLNNLFQFKNLLQRVDLM